MTLLLLAGLLIMTAVYYRLRREVMRQRTSAAMEASEGLTEDSLKRILGQAKPCETPEIRLLDSGP